MSKRFFLSIICPVISLILSLCLACPVAAAKPQDEYRDIQKRIKEQKKKLDRAKKRESSVFTDLDRINRELNIAESRLRKYKTELKNTEDDVARVEAEISENKKTIEKYREWIRRKLRVLHKHGQAPDMVMLFLSSDDISKLLRSGKALQQVTMYENKVLNTLKESLEELRMREKRLTELRARLMKQRAQVRAEEEALAANKKEKEMLLVSIKQEKSSYGKMLEELKSASQRILKIIREAEEREKFTAEGFSKLKGKLPWPLEGRVAIPYGSQRDPRFNTPIFRSGAYFQSAQDTFARAVYSGKVVFAEWFKGYGQLVIINHGEGYHTLYGSLSEIFANVGDIIKENQVIGRIGDSGVLNAPSLYFELRYKGKPLDPLQWLKRK
jgi:septal ring factor EnvC (AmiA/AmiB activator)